MSEFRETEAVEVLRRAVMDDGDVTALMGYADELNLKDHPHAEELAQMAVLANDTEDMAAATVAVAIFFELLKKK